MRNPIHLVKPLKIILINTLYSPNFVGGAERSVQLLAEGLVKQGHNVSVISLQHNSSTISFKVINGVKAYYLSNKSIYWPFTEGKVSKVKKMFWHFSDTYFSMYKSAVKKILEKESPDIIHTNNLSGFSTSLLRLLKAKGYPVIHTARDYYLLCYKNTLYKNGSNCKSLCKDCSILSKWKLENVNANVNMFVGISNHILNRHINTGLSKNMPVKRIYNAVKTTKQYKNPSQNPIKSFGYLGAINKAKGVEVLLNTFCSKDIQDENWSLKIAGKGDSDYVNQIKSDFKSDKIEFLGFVDSNEFYKDLDALIVPSQWEEPFGRVVIEAVQMGVVVFVSENGGLKELIEILETVKKFSAETILDFLKHDNEIVNLEHDNLQCFDNDVITSQYVSAYKKVLLDR